MLSLKLVASIIEEQIFKKVAPQIKDPGKSWQQLKADIKKLEFSDSGYLAKLLELSNIPTELSDLSGLSFTSDKKGDINIIRAKGIMLIRLLAFYRITGFLEAYEKGKYAIAKKLLLEVAGSREKIINNKKTLESYPSLNNIYYNKWFDIVFGHEPINSRKDKAVSATNYWHGSYIKVLTDSFPELKFNLFDFTGKLPRDVEKIFDGGENFIIEQAKEKYQGLNDRNLAEIIIYIVCVLEKAEIPKLAQNIRHANNDYIFSKEKIDWAKKCVIDKYGSIKNFKINITNNNIVYMKDNENTDNTKKHVSNNRIKSLQRNI